MNTITIAGQLHDLEFDLDDRGVHTGGLCIEVSGSHAYYNGVLEVEELDFEEEIELEYYHDDVVAYMKEAVKKDQDTDWVEKLGIVRTSSSIAAMVSELVKVCKAQDNPEHQLHLLVVTLLTVYGNYRQDLGRELATPRED